MKNTNQLINRAKKSKLNETDNQEQEKVVEFTKNIGSTTHSFRFDNQTWQDFQDLLKEINDKHGHRKRISAGQLLKGLIYLGKQSDKKKIIDIIRETYI